MRRIPGIKYSLAGHVPLRGCFAITLIILLAPCAYSQMEVSNRLNINIPQSNTQLVKQGRGEESRMIKDKGLNSSFNVKVTTANQKRFDGNRDGYLSGKELQMYLREYYR